MSADLGERIDAAIGLLPDRPGARRTAVGWWVRRWLWTRTWPESDQHLIACAVLDTVSPASVASHVRNSTARGSERVGGAAA